MLFPSSDQKIEREIMNSAKISPKEKHSRNLALEEDYVHQVYEKIGKDLVYSKKPLEDTVKHFLDDLEHGSLVADIGCGDGRHLKTETSFYLGGDNSCLQAALARQRCQEVILADNLRLPFRGDAFDAVLSVAVIHHLTTRERRIKALKELTRVLKIGGRVFIAVQQQNTQKSQDVLIPWFDGQKQKMKDKYCLDQDTDENEMEYTDEDDDSISLSSSDEDDVLLNFAKFIPSHSQFYSKHGSISDSQANSLDCDYQASSNSVPNSKQIVQVNKCYTFVQKALKRLSSANDPEEDPYIESDLCHRSDSFFSSSVINEQKQKIDFLNDSSSDFDKSIQKAINDNFIELLNIDDERPIPNASHKKDTSFISMKQSHQSSTSWNKGTLIRSLSDVFKNINSLYSNKASQSCSDLKSHVIQSDNDCERGKRLSRLVRSKTTATCNPEFDYCSMLEDIEELDMTINEATKIINDFLESSLPTVQTVKFNNNTSDKSFTSLTQSDIANGNILPLVKDSQMSNAVQEKFQLEFMNSEDETNSVKKGNEPQNKNKLKYMLSDSTCVPDLPEKEKNVMSACSSSNSYKNEIKSSEINVENTSKIETENLLSRCSFNTEQLEKSDLQLLNQNNSFTADNYSSSNIQNSNKIETPSAENNTGYWFLQPNSPKRIRKMTQNCCYQLADSRTLGPFYDEDNHNYDVKDYSVLSPYYSMPELYALSDFHLEYNLYQNSLLRTSRCDETRPVENSQDLAVAEMPHNNKLAENINVLKTDNIIQFSSNNSLLDNTLDGELYNECIKMDLDNSVDSDFTFSSLAEKEDLKRLCNRKVYDDRFIKDERQSFSLVPTSNAKLNPTEFFNLNNKCRSLITIDRANDTDQTCKNTMTTTHINISRSHSTGGMLSGLCQANHGNLTEIPINQNYFHSSYLNLNKFKKIHKNMRLSNSSNDVLNNRFVETYLQENDALLEKDIHNRYNKCAFYNKNEDFVTSASRCPNAMKKFSYCNLNECRNIQSNQDSNINYEIFEKRSKENDNLCPEFDITSSPPQCKNVSIKCKDNYNPDKIKLTLSKSLTIDLKSRINSKGNNNNKDLYCQDINSSLLNSHDALEIRFLEEDLCNTFKSNKSAICSTTLSSKQDSHSINAHLYANLNKGCIDLKQNASCMREGERINLGIIESDPRNSDEKTNSQENIRSSDSSHFLSKNISESKLWGSSDHQKGLVLNTSNIPNGARTIVNSEMPIKSNVNNLTLRDEFISTLANQVEHSTPSTDLVSILSKEQNNITGVAQTHVDSREISYQENVDYMYGRLHEEGAVVVSHRYHHLFQEEELEELIENNVNELHILRSFQCESHWCIIAEKVRVWTI